MPTYKISQLTTATAVSATNQFEINQNGTSKSVEVSVIDAYIKSTSNLPVVVSVSSATDAVRITQTGTGKALVIEDSTNPDSTPIVFNADGQLLVGTSVNVASTTGIQVAQAGNNVTAPVIDFSKERAGATVIDGQSLGTVRFWGYDGAAFRQAGSILGSVNGTPGSDIMPGQVEIRTRTAAVGGGETGRLAALPWGGVTIGYQVGSGPALGVTVPAKLRVASDAYTDTASAASATIATGTINSIQTTAVAAANTGVTYTNLSTLYIQGAPTASTNVTITNPWSLYVAAGASYFGGQLQTAAGTAAAPAISPAGDTNTGMFFPAADTIAFAEGGAEFLRFDSSGRILQGTTTNVAATTSHQLAQSGVSSTSATIDFTKSRGGATIVSGDNLGYFRFWGMDGSATPAFITGAYIVAEAAGTPGSNTLPTSISFATRDAVTTNAGDVRLVINSTGQIYAGGGSATGAASTVNNPTKLRITGSTYTDSTTAASGTASHGTTIAIAPSNLAAVNTGVTYTNASTLYISSAPSAGTNVTITNAFAINVASGASYFGGQVQGSAGTASAPTFSRFGDTNTGMFFPADDTLAISTAGTERMRITSTGNIVAGGSVALATTATDGFLYVPTCAGTPTGTPTTITGMAPIVINTTNNKLYFYSGGAWRDAGP